MYNIIYEQGRRWLFFDNNCKCDIQKLYRDNINDIQYICYKDKPFNDDDVRRFYIMLKKSCKKSRISKMIGADLSLSKTDDSHEANQKYCKRSIYGFCKECSGYTSKECEECK